jgi:hypothetical protein
VAAKFCIPTKATKAQQQRLRRLLNQLNPRHREGLQEFLYANRDNLDAAIADLEGLVDEKRIQAALDDAFDRLERGDLPAAGDYRWVSRLGRPGRVPDIGPAPGRRAPGQRLVPGRVKLAQKVLGRKLSDFGRTGSGLPVAVRTCWEEAVKAVRAAHPDPLTKTLMNETLYPAAQRAFWRRVRANTTARRFFEDNAFIFRGGDDTAPLFEAVTQFRRREKEFSIELDHMLPKGRGEVYWEKALDADNLQLLIGWDNWLLDQIERVDATLRR